MVELSLDLISMYILSKFKPNLYRCIKVKENIKLEEKNFFLNLMSFGTYIKASNFEEK